MDLNLSTRDGVPIYLQILNQIKGLISSGRLAPGEELPPIRVLAQRLLINPNTVARAYRDLDQQGWLTKRRGAGTYVSETPPVADEGAKMLRERISVLLTESRQMGLSTEELIELIRQASRSGDDQVRS